MGRSAATAIQFTLGDVPNTRRGSRSPTPLEVAYPEQLSRRLVLVKWWLLAIPHYIVVALLVGSGGYAASEEWTFGFEIGLIGGLVLFAGFALLFAARYPRGIFDFVVGLDRWVARVATYVLLMRDEYPPFRLEQGGAEAVAFEGAAPGAASERESNGSRGAGRRRPALIVAGVIAAVVAFALLTGGCALIAIDRTQRDAEGFLTSASDELSSPTHAIVSETADVDFDGAERLLESFIGTVRIRSESDRAAFVGIGPSLEVERYLDGVEHDLVTDLDEEPRYSRRTGGAPVTPPDEAAFWVESVTGAGKQTLDVNLGDGDWRMVVMNDDATRNVSSEISIGAEFNAISRVGVGLLVAGALLLAGAALALVAGVRGRVRGAAQAVAADVS